MVRGLFCHSLPIYKDINGEYCSTTLTDDLFNRYLDVVDELVVATRVYHINKTFSEAHQERITTQNVHIVEFENLNNPRILLSKIWHELDKMSKLIDDADLIFIRGGVIALLAASVAQKKKKEYLVEVAGCIFDEYWNYSLLGKFVAPWLELLQKKAIRNADFALYVTERWLQERYPTRGISTNASNVILHSFDDSVLEKRVFNIQLEDKDRITIGTTAGLSTKAKGQQYVIKALGKLTKKYDLRYEMIGGGDSSYLESVAKKNGVQDYIEFKGQMTHKEVLTWLDSIDVYIQPSMQEGLPRALIEAMSRGCPAIGSSTAGIPELLDPKCVFKRGNVKSLIVALDKLLASDLKDQAIRNYNKAKEFEYDLLQNRRIKLYTEFRDSVLRRKKV